MKRYRSGAEKKRTAAIVSAVVLVLVAVLLVEVIPWQGKKERRVWTPILEFSEAEAFTVEKDPDRDFKILNFTDIQLNDFLDLFDQGVRTFRAMDRLVAEVQPDLITLTGDQVWAPPFTRNSVRKLIKKLDSYGIPWAPVYGNHDNQGNVDLNWIADRMMETEHCLFKKGFANVDGVGNYVIHIKENGRIIHTLMMMDSNRYRTYDKKYGKKEEYDFVQPSQLDWYEWAITGTEALAGAPVESTVFMHIPPIQYQMAYDAWKASGFDPEMGYGKNAEDVCSAPIDGGFFDTILRLDSTKQIVCGHDHINNSSILYEGIRLTYAMKTGNRVYHDEERMGGTVFTVNGEGHLSAPVYLVETGR